MLVGVTIVRTQIVDTPKRLEFDVDVAEAIEALAGDQPIVSVSVTPIRQRKVEDNILTKRVLVTVVVDA